MKLHLGCGQRHFDGYINIDYPLSKHSVQLASVADQLADITTLRHKKESIEEVRLHHVFEHFNRQTAMALLVCWHSWLKEGGILHIEVPDYYRTTLEILNPLSPLSRQFVGFRHIFGSHEAVWANHYEGWTSKSLSFVLQKLGFEIVKVSRNSWKRTHNIEIICRKKSSSCNKAEQTNSVKDLLQLFLVDDSKSEQALLELWMTEYHQQVKKCYAATR